MRGREPEPSTGDSVKAVGAMEERSLGETLRAVAGLELRAAKSSSSSCGESVNRGLMLLGFVEVASMCDVSCWCLSSGPRLFVTL